MTIEPPQQYASEGGRFYERDGTPLNLVPNKSKPGEFRKATLADCRKISGLPSVTTILGVISKPGLDTWKVDQYLNAAFEMPPIGAETREDWISAVRNLAAGQMDICRDLGTEVHGAINRHFKGEDSEPRFDPFLEAAVNALKEIGVWDLQVREDLETEKTFANLEFGYAGCVDLSTNGASRVIIDWKAIDRLEKTKTFVERNAQTVAYGRGLYGNVDFRCFNIFIGTNEPGKYEIKEWDTTEQAQGWEVFDAANRLYRAINNYHP